MSTPIDEKFPSKRFGEKLRILREKYGLSQRQLGDLVNVSQVHIYRLEKSQKNPNAAMLLKLIRVFDVSIDVLLRDELDLDL